MARILAAIVFAIAGSISLSAGALGLGEIDLKSALNQPFNAEILVVSGSPGDFDGLHVEIAPAETFRQFGLDRAAFLSGFTFSVVPRGTGGVVQITSAQPVVEPFVTLLLEVSWAQGRLLREYTVLLDPPVFATESFAPAVAAPTAGPAVVAPIPRDEMVPVMQSGAANTAGADDGFVYGPVRRSDTLWAIAGRLVEQSSLVTRNQMMLAIYQANPDAFNGNINRLKAGMILRVPSTSEIAYGSREATSEVRRQNQQWRSTTVTEDERQGGRLRLVPPPERDASDPRVGAGDGVADAARDDALAGRASELENQLAESRRLLQVRDQELEALQRQLAEVSAAPDAELVVDETPIVDESELVAEFEAPDLSAGDTASGQQAVEIDPPVAGDVDSVPPPVDVTPIAVEREDKSFLVALFTNPLVYIALAFVLALAWLFARNRAASDDTALAGRWDALEVGDDGDLNDETHEATTRLRAQPPHDETFVVEEALPSDETDQGSVDQFADESSGEWGGLAEEGETPLERTISTDSAVNLDQADPIAESDFHMAYGLYDQAADLLTRALEIEPERKDLRMKLLEVFFIWENQEGFLKEAEALHQRIDDAADPDWNKVLIMGKQICPDADRFAGGATLVGATDSVDLEFGEEGGANDVIDFTLDDGEGSSVDLHLDDGDASLDLDLTGDADSGADSDVLDFDVGDEDEVTQIVADDNVEMSGDAATMETPTVELPATDGASTMETPTLESPLMEGGGDTDGESTMETPTIETAAGQWDDDSGSGGEATAEINLDDLDLDLSGLDDIDALDADSDTVDVEMDAAAAGTGFFATVDSLQLDGTQERPAISLDDLPADISALDELADDVESTAEMENLITPSGGETVAYRSVGGVGDTAEQPNLAADDTMFDVGETPLSDDDPTAQVGDGGVDGATMTEVGTKLDLARAYIDMGDPDGARSILNEVLEEADKEQKQEAQKLLDDLAD